VIEKKIEKVYYNTVYVKLGLFNYNSMRITNTRVDSDNKVL